MQGLGAAVGKFAGVFDAFGAEQNKRDEANAKMTMLETSIKLDKDLHDASQSYTGDGRGFRDTSEQSYDRKWGEVISTLPDSQREKAKLFALQKKSSYVNEAERHQDNHGVAYVQQRLPDFYGNVLGASVTKESVSEFGIEPAKAAIETGRKFTSNAPISAAARAKLEKSLQIATANKVAEVIDPVQYKKMMAAELSTKKIAGNSKLPSNAVGKALGLAASNHGVNPDILASITKIESGFNPKAKNPLSSARGLGQFINSTAKQYGLKNDGTDSVQAQSEALARLTKDNITTLQQRLKREPAPGEIYLAHFLGVGKAASIGKVDNKASAQGVLGSAVINANPFLRGKNIGQVKDWAAKKMGTSSGPVVSGDTFTNELFSPKNQKLVQKRFETEIETNIHGQLKGQPSIMVENRIDALRQAARNNPNVDGADIAIKAAEDFKSDLDKNLKSDPLGFANDQNIVEVPLLFNDKNPVEGFQKRLQAAQKVSDIYKIPLQLMRPEEKLHFETMISTMPTDQKLQMFAAIDKGFGKNAPKFFHEFSKTDVGFAHIGGLYLNGKKEAASLGLAGMTAMQDKNNKEIVATMKATDVMSAFNSVFGNSFSLGKEGDVGGFVATGKAIAFQLMATGKHTDPLKALQEGLTMASGYSEHNGKQIGGVGEFNDQSYLIAPDMEADLVEQTFEFITSRSEINPNNPNAERNAKRGLADDGFDFFESMDESRPINPDTQLPVKAEDLRDAVFVSVGQGQYIIKVDGVPLWKATPERSEDGKLLYDKYVFDMNGKTDKIKKLVGY